MQKRIRFAAFDVIRFFKRRVCIGKIGTMFWMLVKPLACYRFNSF